MMEDIAILTGGTVIRGARIWSSRKLQWILGKAGTVGVNKDHTVIANGAGG